MRLRETTIATGAHHCRAGTIGIRVEVKDGIGRLYAQDIFEPIVICEGFPVSFQVEVPNPPARDFFMRWTIAREQPSPDDFVSVPL